MNEQKVYVVRAGTGWDLDWIVAVGLTEDSARKEAQRKCDEAHIHTGKNYRLAVQEMPLTI